MIIETNWFIEWRRAEDTKVSLSEPLKSKKSATSKIKKLLNDNSVVEVRVIKQVITAYNWVQNDR